MTKDTEGLWTALARLLEDLRFAPAEGGFEVNDANRRSGAFLSKYGEALLGLLASREAGRLEAQTWQPQETTLPDGTHITMTPLPPAPSTSEE